MSNDKKTPEGYFPLSDDDIIISDHAKRLLEQERAFIQNTKPMEKLEQAFLRDMPLSNFSTRVNGAGQLSIYRAGDEHEKSACIILSARILAPCMSEKRNPEISIRFSVQKENIHFYFARLAAIKTPDGTTSCAVCAIRNNSDSEYYFEDNHGTVFTGSELDIPITADDLMVATRLNKHDLIAAVSLSSKLIGLEDVDLFDTLTHLNTCLKNFNF